MKRARIGVAVRGAVQGVGFRPFVYRLASELEISGWVLNSSQGVSIEAEGPPDSLQQFLSRLKKELPARAVVQGFRSWPLEPLDDQAFEIRTSHEGGSKTALILPDLATCADCLHEIFDPADRRFRYPFTNCTNCGPRFSIIAALPYDRANTSMRKFVMCDECDREYRDPGDRRFHAEPTACPRCGPHLELWNSLDDVVSQRDAALLQAAAEIRSGRIVALKGLGGFQLLVAARDKAAVIRLRERKRRAEKPFAVLFPSLGAIRSVCALSELEERLLDSSESPIVLLRQLTQSGWCSAVSPGNPNLGAMLPYTPLHHLLMRELGFPVVATSGNLSDEPICIDEREALDRLGEIADFFLVHDRPIVRHVDDSIVRVIAGRTMMLRRARGYAPLPITLASSHLESKSVLAVGAHLKNAVALRIDSEVFVSQHIGDLATSEAHEAFRRSVADLPRLYDVQPELIAHDLHPEYLSTKHALRDAGQHLAVQHHWAHIASCMAEQGVAPPLLGVAWDGTGHGTDGSVWGGEFFLVRQNSCERVAHLRRFRLPGGEAAVKEPRRSALGLLYEVFGEQIWSHHELLEEFSAGELLTLKGMLAKGINSPLTSSAGRLFDGVAALAGLRARSTFEGQAAMDLEFAVDPAINDTYPFALTKTSPVVIDWGPAVEALLADRSGSAASLMAARFHHFLADAICAVAHRFAQPRVVLSGGCFQNRYLTERVIADLRREGFQPFWHERIPPNDGGIALGQVYAAISSIGLAP